LTDEWLASLQRVLTKQETMERTFLRLLEGAKQDHARAQQKLDRLEESMKKRRALRTKEAEQLLLMRDDPIVLVRNYGAYREVYHSAEHPCGRVHRSGGYDRVLWGKAQADGKRPCSSCGWRADREAHQVRPPEAEAAG
jgi:hypothetical protein